MFSTLYGTYFSFFIWKISHEDALLGVEKTIAQHEFFNAWRRIRVRYFSYKNNQLIILFIIYLINIIIFNFSIYKCWMKKSSSYMTTGNESESWYRH